MFQLIIPSMGENTISLRSWIDIILCGLVLITRVMKGKDRSKSNIYSFLLEIVLLDLHCSWA